jgi:hypothetical protein
MNYKNGKLKIIGKLHSVKQIQLLNLTLVSRAASTTF